VVGFPLGLTRPTHLIPSTGNRRKASRPGAPCYHDLPPTVVFPWFSRTSRTASSGHEDDSNTPGTLPLELSARRLLRLDASLFHKYRPKIRSLPEIGSSPMARSGQSTGPPSHVVDPISKLRRPTPPLSPGRESHAQRPTTSLQPRARSHGPRSFFLAGYFERGRHSPTMGSVDVEGHTKDDSGNDRPGGGCRDNEPSAPSSMHVVDTHSTTHERDLTAPCRARLMGSRTAGVRRIHQWRLRECC
jgi:hypothetical protein